MSDIVPDTVIFEGNHYLNSIEEYNRSNFWTNSSLLVKIIMIIGVIMVLTIIIGSGAYWLGKHIKKSKKTAES